MQVDLAGRVALVTGAATGIGKACAETLVGNGATVVFSDRDLDRVRETAGNRGDAIAIDVADRAAITSGVADVLARHGRIDILVNNAGVAVARNSGTLTTDTTPDAFDYLIDVNLKSVQLCCAAVAPTMKAQRSGVIVNISSQTGISLLEGGNLAVYGAAKAGVAYLTRTLAAELGPHGIRINAIAPGIVETERLKRLDPAMGVGTERQREAIALRRFGSTEDLANVVEFLSTDQSSYVTGQVISVCGGAVLHPS